MDDFCEMYRCRAEELPESVVRWLQETNTRYRSPRVEEHKTLLTRAREELERGGLARSPAENVAAFSRGWQENLDLCRREGVSWETLRPRYVRPYPAMRLGGEYVFPEDPLLYDHLQAAAALYTAHRYLAETETLVEFGCGTGRFLYLLATTWDSSKTYIGTDWAPPSLELLRYIGDSCGFSLRGALFDMFHPSFDFSLPPNSGVYTVHALEQLGKNYVAFLDYLLAMRPAVVVHHEPVVEFYDERILFDSLAAKYHRARGYLEDYLPALRRLESEGRVEILAAFRPHYGPFYQESNCLVVWRPVRGR